MTAEELTAWLKTLAADIRRTKPDYPLNVVPGYPIPFFGDVLHARVLTVGVNPSDTEFTPTRHWEKGLKVPEWQNRLLRYFNWPVVPPNAWFETWSICLEFLGLAYTAGHVAHIDVSPRPTIPMLDEQTDPVEFRAMIEHDAKWFFQLLKKLPEVQLLLIAGPVPRTDGRKQQLADFIREHSAQHGLGWTDATPFCRLITPGCSTGIPVFICPYEPGVDGLYATVRHVYRNRSLLRGFVGVKTSANQPGAPLAHLPDRLNWPLATSLFLRNFSTLEYFVTVFLKDNLPEEQFVKATKLHFTDRLLKISQLLAEKGCSSDQQDSFKCFLERVKPIRDLRNTIAHGPYHLGLDPQTQKPVLTVVEANQVDAQPAPGPEHVRLEDLINRLGTLSELIEEIQLLAGFLPATNQPSPLLSPSPPDPQSPAPSSSPPGYP